MNEDVAAAVRSLEASRSALAAALGKTPSLGRRRAERLSRSANSSDGIWGALWSSLAEATGEQWRYGSLRASLEHARPAIEDAVRRQPWTAVTVAGLCGAVAIWIVSTRRRLIFSAARLWWRTAGMAILASAAFKMYEHHVAATDAPSPPGDSENEAGPAQDD